MANALPMPALAPIIIIRLMFSGIFLIANE
jgi:hypothetical protein